MLERCRRVPDEKSSIYLGYRLISTVWYDPRNCNPLRASAKRRHGNFPFSVATISLLALYIVELLVNYESAVGRVVESQRGVERKSALCQLLRDRSFSARVNHVCDSAWLQTEIKYVSVPSPQTVHRTSRTLMASTSTGKQKRTYCRIFSSSQSDSWRSHHEKSLLSFIYRSV